MNDLEEAHDSKVPFIMQARDGTRRNGSAHPQTKEGRLGAGDGGEDPEELLISPNSAEK